jgi:hypothetical protein
MRFTETGDAISTVLQDLPEQKKTPPLGTPFLFGVDRLKNGLFSSDGGHGDGCDGIVAHIGFDLCDFVENIQSIDNDAENGVLTIEELVVLVIDIELAAGRGFLRVVVACCGKCSPFVGVLDFCRNAGVRAAGAVQHSLRLVARKRVAALNHKILDDPVKPDAIEIFLRDKLLEVVAVFRRIVVKLDGDITKCGFNYELLGHDSVKINCLIVTAKQGLKITCPASNSNWQRKLFYRLNFNRDGLLRVVECVAPHLRNLVDDFHPLNHAAKDGVVAVIEPVVVEVNEKLAA